MHSRARRVSVSVLLFSRTCPILFGHLRFRRRTATTCVERGGRNHVGCGDDGATVAARAPPCLHAQLRGHSHLLCQLLQDIFTRERCQAESFPYSRRRLLPLLQRRDLDGDSRHDSGITALIIPRQDRQRRRVFDLVECLGRHVHRACYEVPGNRRGRRAVTGNGSASRAARRCIQAAPAIAAATERRTTDSHATPCCTIDAHHRAAMLGTGGIRRACEDAKADRKVVTLLAAAALDPWRSSTAARQRGARLCVGVLPRASPAEPGIGQSGSLLSPIGCPRRPTQPTCLRQLVLKRRSDKRSWRRLAVGGLPAWSITLPSQPAAVEPRRPERSGRKNTATSDQLWPPSHQPPRQTCRLTRLFC